MTANQNVSYKCPKCGCTEIEPNRGFIRDSSGDIIGEDFDPECKQCGEWFDDSWEKITNEVEEVYYRVVRGRI